MGIKTRDSFSLWGIGPLDAKQFSTSEWNYLQQLPTQLPSVQSLWGMMDEIWSNLGLDNRRPLDQQPIDSFYSHPIWLANGFFSQADISSKKHRIAVARHLANRGLHRVADFGGGFGELAVRISEMDPQIDVTIIEPFPSRYAIDRIVSNPRLRYEKELDFGYDAVIAQDVLEHVNDPIALACRLASSVKVGGEIIFANCFYPVIHCHLPQTFHLRHTFSFHMRALGLSSLSSVDGAPHIQVFKREVSNLSLGRARKVEFLSQFLGQLINLVRN